jgi:hypothetical protein
MLIASVVKNSREEIRIELTEYKGHRLVGCRVWARKATDEWVPTQKGITFKVGLLADVLDGLQKAQDELQRQGLPTDG